MLELKNDEENEKIIFGRNEIAKGSNSGSV
jgi:hypothetical protein